ncbi:hypothetical protein OAM34_00925 [Alphaproteobacteria bacterium]|nr:hypothetical protein [Alphaproteobacteria bacterium]
MSFLAKMVAWHKKIFENRWFTQRVTLVTIALALLLGAVASYMNFQARHINWQMWTQNKAEFFVEDTPLFTTMDAGYFLGIAGYLKSGKTVEDYQALRVYPENLNENQPLNTQSRSAPLLSKTIAYFAEDASPQSLLTAGNKILPYTAVITVIAIFIAFAVTGYWLEASVAAAGGGLSLAYYWRSSMGRIDTDQLNLGFMYFMFAMVMCAGKATNVKYGLLFTIIAGITAHLFMYWYGKAELIIMAAIALFWLLLVLSRDWRRYLGFTILFLLISGVGLINPFDSIYLRTGLDFDNFIFSNVISTVTEASRVDIMEIFYRMTGSVLISVMCVFGILLWAFCHPVMAVAYAPLAGFFVLNMFIGNRAAFYSAPFFWFGAAYLAVLVTKMIIYQVSAQFENSKHFITSILSPAASFGVCAILLILVWLAGPAYQLAKPSIPAPVIKAMLFLNQTEIQSEKSVVASWWDYGYASMLFNNLPTFTDPGSHGGKSNYFIADALLADNQAYTADILRFLARGGLDSLDMAVANSSELRKKILADRSKQAPAVYFMLTDQMTSWMPSISKIGKWDIDLGAPMRIEGNNLGQPLSYNFVSCADTTTPGIVRCNNSPVDLREGMIDNKPVLSMVSETRGGRFFGGKRFRDNALNMVQIMKDSEGKSTRVAILHKELFLSSYNQMFHLGRFDTKNFKLIYDGYPFVRIFKLLPAS